MEESEKEVEKRKNDLILNIKNVNTSLFFIAFVLIIIVRIYFFMLTKNQPLWWDESEYMSIAKAIAGVVDFDFSWLRSPGFPLLVSIFLSLGVKSEVILKFMVAFLPSIIVLGLTYFTVKEMYKDEKIAVVSMLILAFIWEHIFYSNRFHTENLSLIFQFLSIIVLFKVYMKKDKFLGISPKYSLIFVGLFSILSVAFRPGNIIFVPALFIFIPLVNTKYFIENKNKTYVLLFALLAIALVLLFNLSKIPLISSYYHPENQISFNSLNVFHGFFSPSLLFQGLFFYFFLIGIIVFAFNFYLRMPFIKQFKRDGEDLEFKSDIFNFILIGFVTFTFIFLMRVSAFEYRWFFPLILGVVAFSSKGIFSISKFVGKYKKEAASFFVIIVLVLGLYGQFDYSKDLVLSKVNSYEQVKEAGLWIKENSNPDDVVVSASVPQNTYYSERKTYNFALDDPTGAKSEDYFNENLERINPKYIVVSVFEPSFTPEWAYSWPQSNQSKAVPVQAYFSDPQKQQPVLIIYQINQ
jgi:hypothetical protein